MSKATKPTTIMIRDGIGARLKELGFERKSQRHYRKETGHISEWVHFSIDREDFVVDTYGVFDNAMQAYLDEYLGKEESPGSSGLVRPAHASYRSRNLARHEAFVGYEAWKATRRIWRPLDYFRDPPDDVIHWMYPFLSHNGRWDPSNDPEGCAAASQAAFREGIEPNRNEILADNLAIARIWIDSMHVYRHERVVLLCYLGDRVTAQEQAEEAIALDGREASEAYIERSRKHYESLGGTVEELRTKVRENNTNTANEMRDLVVKLRL